ncbi:MAG: class I SAM-dependent methyltransferase, partial [Acidobacteriota bacterium]
RLSFGDQSFDLVVSFDVLEHVPAYLTAFDEILRVLSPGGTLYFTVPFRVDRGDNLVRARLAADGSVEHLLEPEYHGDPLVEEGCLAFYHYGWQLLDDLRSLGFVDVALTVYWSQWFGYLGRDQLVLTAAKPA